MTPAEFRAAKTAAVPWADDRIRDELAKAMQEARDALELGVHVLVPESAVDATLRLARAGGWTTHVAQRERFAGQVRVDLAPGGPRISISLVDYHGGLTSRMTVGGRCLWTADEHREFVAESKPIQPVVAAKFVDDALAASLQAAEDDVPAVRVRRHSVQQVVDAAAAQGWHCYVEHRGAFIDAIPVDVRPNDEVTIGLFGEPFTLANGDTLVSLAPTPTPTVRHAKVEGRESGRLEHTFDFYSCERCAEDERRGADVGCRFSPDKANGAGDRQWGDT